MASWMVHFRIAEALLTRIPGLDAEQFAIGNIAPDSGLPNDDWTAFDPPKTITHFQPEDAVVPYKIHDMAFYRQYLVNVDQSDKPRFSFLLGYFFHLVTDNLWSIQVWRPTNS